MSTNNHFLKLDLLQWSHPPSTNLPSLLELSILPSCVPSPTSLKSSSPVFSKEVEDYISLSKNLLDFNSIPRVNHSIYPWMDNIDILDEIVYDSNKFFKVLLMTAYDLGYKRMTYKQQFIVAEAILNRKSFLAGHSKSLIKPTTFH